MAKNGAVAIGRYVKTAVLEKGLGARARLFAGDAKIDTGLGKSEIEVVHAYYQTQHGNGYTSGYKNKISSY